MNTSSTRIELLWNVRESRALPDDVRDRVMEKLASRLDSEGWVRIVSASRRSQGQNREAAEERLVALIQGALMVRKPRRATKPTFGSRQERLAGKKRRSDTKRMRRPDED